MFYSKTVAASFVLSAITCYSAAAEDSNDMVKQLLPSPPPSATAVQNNVLSLASATKSEMISRLGDAVLTRSLDPKSRPAAPLDLSPGHEAIALTTLEKLPSMQVAVAFQGGSDALSPEAGVLLSALGQALADKKLQPYRFAIGVHTNSVGSEEYNISLARLRAKAIVDTLVAVHGINRDRLISIGFGRMADRTIAGDAPSERIQIVNLGDIPVTMSAAPATVVSQTPAAVVAPHMHPAMHQHAHGRAVAVAHDRKPNHVRHFASVHIHHPHKVLSSTQDEAEVLTYSRPRRHRAVIQQPMGEEGAPAPAYGAEIYNSAFNNAAHSSASSGGGGSGGSGGGGSSSSGSSGGSAGSGSSSGSSGGSSSGSGGSSSGSGGSSGGHWSDRRLKRHVVHIGRSKQGHDIYSFQYIWGGPHFVGVMAQDVLKHTPEAVIIGPEGHMMVDYSKIDLQMITLDTWRAERNKDQFTAI